MTLVTSSDYIALTKFMTLYGGLYMVQIMNIWQVDFKPQKWERAIQNVIFHDIVS